MTPQELKKIEEAVGIIKDLRLSIQNHRKSLLPVEQEERNRFVLREQAIDIMLSLANSVLKGELVEPMGEAELREAFIYNNHLGIERMIHILLNKVGSVGKQEVVGEEELSKYIQNTDAWKNWVGEEDDYDEAKQFLKDLVHALASKVRPQITRGELVVMINSFNEHGYSVGWLADAILARLEGEGR